MEVKSFDCYREYLLTGEYIYSSDGLKNYLFVVACDEFKKSTVSKMKVFNMGVLSLDVINYINNFTIIFYIYTCYLSILLSFPFQV